MLRERETVARVVCAGITRPGDTGVGLPAL
jgi:hypothetical protein